MPDIDIDAGRFQTLTTMINAENLPNQTHYREVLSQIVSPNSAFLGITNERTTTARIHFARVSPLICCPGPCERSPQRLADESSAPVLQGA